MIISIDCACDALQRLEVAREASDRKRPTSRSFAVAWYEACIDVLRLRRATELVREQWQRPPVLAESSVPLDLRLAAKVGAS